jgi:hypothetical protein
MKHTFALAIGYHRNIRLHLCNERRRSSTVILEGRRDLLLRLIVPRQPMNPALNQDQPELRVLVFAVDFEMFADCNRLFDEVPEVLWDGRCQSYPQTKGVFSNRKIESTHNGAETKIKSNKSSV